MPSQHINILGYLIDQCSFIGLGEIDETVIGAKVVDILHYTCLWVLLLSLDCRTFHIIYLVFYLLFLEISEGVLHHYEVNLGYASDLD